MICRAYQCAARLCRAFAPSLRTAPLQSSVRPWSTECICGPLAFRRVAAGELGQRKIRGSRKRGYKKPQVSCTPFCPCRRAAARPARRSVRNPRRRRRQKGPCPPRAQSPVPGIGDILASCVYRRRNGGTVRPLPRREEKGRSPSEGEKTGVPLSAFSGIYSNFS